MKFPDHRTGLSTPGGMSIAVVVLVSTGFISPWWLIASTLLFVWGVGHEHGNNNASKQS